MAGNIIEVRPLNGGWEVSERFEHLKFSTVKGALVYARFRLLLRPGEIRIFDATGTRVETIASPPQEQVLLLRSIDVNAAEKPLPVVLSQFDYRRL